MVYLRLKQFSFLLVIACAMSSLARGAEEDALVFSVVRWQGEWALPGMQSSTTIYTIGADGSDLKQITALKPDSNNPFYSPDGQWVYCQGNPSGEYHIYRCRTDGSNLQQLTSAQTLGPRWKMAYGLQMTPDGRLLFTVHGKVGCVALAEPDGSDMRVVAPHLGYLYMSALSPSGDALVFAGPASGYRLWLVRLPDAFQPDVKPEALTPDHPESFVPQFTPDGRSLVFVRRDGDVYRVDLGGGGVHRLTQGNNYVEFRLSPRDEHGSSDGPRISPDGRHIAYIAVRDGIANVFTMNLDGTDQKQITFRKVPCGRVRWSPDSQRIAFVSFEGKYTQLFVVPAGGGEPRQLTHLDGAVYFLEWNMRKQ